MSIYCGHANHQFSGLALHRKYTNCIDLLEYYSFAEKKKIFGRQRQVREKKKNEIIGRISVEKTYARKTFPYQNSTVSDKNNIATKGQ